mmetsp:Transcript_3987/g.6177  ORF Transcript_3987/g.6177 Transcript_3987/m.6177 type:complete len:378 (+) Transcript_3987:2-1135(+)
MGSKVVFATDEWFAAAENLIKNTEPIFITDKFTTYGKWMDGWESRRKRTAGHDWCIIELGLPGEILGVKVDTLFFTGNQAPRFSLQACEMPQSKAGIVERLKQERRGYGIGTCASKNTLSTAEQLGSDKWTTLVEFTPLRPGYEGKSMHFFQIPDSFLNKKWTHVRVNSFPDGGIARMRLFGTVKKDISRRAKVMDLAAAENGGVAVACSNAHYGKAANLIALGRATNMGEGWETARKPNRPAVLTKGSNGLIDFKNASDFCVLKLCCAGNIGEIEIDTNHFKGNFPESCIVEGCYLKEKMTYQQETALFLDSKRSDSSMKWVPVLERTKLTPHAQVRFSVKKELGPITHVRITIYPDGGVSRLRVFGVPVTAKSSL